MGQEGAEPLPRKMTRSPEHLWGVGAPGPGNARCGREEMESAVRALKTIVSGRLWDSQTRENRHVGGEAIRGRCRACWRASGGGGCEVGVERVGKAPPPPPPLAPLRQE